MRPFATIGLTILGFCTLPATGWGQRGFLPFSGPVAPHGLNDSHVIAIPTQRAAPAMPGTTLSGLLTFTGGTPEQRRIVREAYDMMRDHYAPVMLTGKREEPIAIGFFRYTGQGYAGATYNGRGTAPRIEIADDQKGESRSGNSLLLTAAHEFGHAFASPAWSIATDGSFVGTEQVNEYLMRSAIDPAPDAHEKDETYRRVVETVASGKLPHDTLARAFYGGDPDAIQQSLAALGIPNHTP